MGKKYEPQDAPQAPRLLRLPDVMARTGFSRSTIYSLMEKGRFPKFLPIGERAVAWVESEISEWIHARIEERK